MATKAFFLRIATLLEEFHDKFEEVCPIKIFNVQFFYFTANFVRKPDCQMKNDCLSIIQICEENETKNLIYFWAGQKLW